MGCGWLRDKRTGFFVGWIGFKNNFSYLSFSSKSLLRVVLI